MYEPNQYKVKKLNKSGKPVYSGKNGGYRPGSGRKPNMDKKTLEEVRARISEHCLQKLEGKRDGKLVRLTRLQALLDVLFSEGMKGNIAAIKEYLDRTIGKALPAYDEGGGTEELVCTIIGDPQKYKLDKTH